MRSDQVFLLLVALCGPRPFKLRFLRSRSLLFCDNAVILNRFLWRFASIAREGFKAKRLKYESGEITGFPGNIMDLGTDTRTGRGALQRADPRKKDQGSGIRIVGRYDCIFALRPFWETPLPVAALTSEFCDRNSSWEESKRKRQRK